MSSLLTRVCRIVNRGKRDLSYLTHVYLKSDSSRKMVIESDNFYVTLMQPRTLYLQVASK